MQAAGNWNDSVQRTMTGTLKGNPLSYKAREISRQFSASPTAVPRQIAIGGEKGPFLCSESAKCGTHMSGRRRNPSQVGESYGPAAFTRAGLPITGTLPRLDLGRVCCVKYAGRLGGGCAQR
jgi:hypothetical protein